MATSSKPSIKKRVKDNLQRLKRFELQPTLIVHPPSLIINRPLFDTNIQSISATYEIPVAAILDSTQQSHGKKQIS